MKALSAVSIAFGAILAASCVRAGGGYSLDDPNYFAQRPYVIGGADQYSLCWRYGTMGFFFQPSSRIVNGKLVFALHGTSSSGALTGRYGKVMISGPDAVGALHSGGAFWLEPDGPEVKLDVQSSGNCSEPNNLLQATRETRAPERRR
jgi:hypothetical protein